MGLYRFAALALVTAPFTAAFQDTSPFFLFSSSRLDVPELLDLQVSDAAPITEAVVKSLRSCPSDDYIIVSQPNVSSLDYRRNVPHLRRRLQGEDRRTETAVAVPDVYGGLDVRSIADVLKTTCGASSVHIDASTGIINLDTAPTPRLITVDFPAPRAAGGLLTHDSFLASVLASLGNDAHTVIYTTAPRAASSAHDEAEMRTQLYAMEDGDLSDAATVRMDLKRDLSASRPDRNATGADVGLFEKYQFLSPGIFMGLLAILPFVAILYVGIRAVTGLEVSYYAFSKEMGPAAQKKQQ